MGIKFKDVSSKIASKSKVKGALSKADDQKKKTLLLYGTGTFAVIAILSYLIYKGEHSKPAVAVKPPSHFIVQGKGNLYKEEWRVGAEQQLQKLQQQNQQLQQEIQSLKNQSPQSNQPNNNQPNNNQLNNTNNTNKKSPPLTSLVVPPPTSQSNKNIAIPPPPPPPPSGAFPPPPPGSPEYSNYSHYQPPPKPKFEELKDLIEVKNFETNKSSSNSQATQAITQTSNTSSESASETIPAGSFVRGILISGLDAPVGTNAQSNPMPVLIRVTSRTIMPNFWKANIRNCFAIGSGYGDLSSQRVYIRLNLLSCVTNDGHVLEKKVKGYVAGRDGKIGILGRVVSKQGQLIGRAIVAGFINGISQMFNYSQQTIMTSSLGTTTTLNPSATFQAGAVGGAAQAAQELAKYYMKLLNMTMPVIEVNAGQRVDMVFLAPINFGNQNQTTVATTSEQPNQSNQSQSNQSSYYGLIHEEK